MNNTDLFVAIDFESFKILVKLMFTFIMLMGAFSALFLIGIALLCLSDDSEKSKELDYEI